MPRGTQEGTSLHDRSRVLGQTNHARLYPLFSSTERAIPPGRLLNSLELPRTCIVMHLSSLRSGLESAATSATRRQTSRLLHGDRDARVVVRVGHHRSSMAVVVQPSRRRGRSAGRRRCGGCSAESPRRDRRRSAERGRAQNPAAFTSGGLPPDALTGEIENALGHGRHAWPLPAIRRLADVLLDASRRAAAWGRRSRLDGSTSRDSAASGHGEHSTTGASRNCARSMRRGWRSERHPVPGRVACALAARRGWLQHGTAARVGAAGQRPARDWVVEAAASEPADRARGLAGAGCLERLILPAIEAGR